MVFTQNFEIIRFECKILTFLVFYSAEHKITFKIYGIFIYKKCLFNSISQNMLYHTQNVLAKVFE